MTDDKNKSFVERFAKKQNFSSQKIEEVKKDPQNNSAPQQKSESNFLDSVKQQAPKKPVNLQKKMQADLIYLVKGIDAGRNAWYYILVERPKVQLFLKALNDDIIHLDQYGEILFSAYGEEPPSDITEKLKEEYGIIN